MHKKGALELSITAIVVLIIAITLLGLGIGFIKKQFGGATEIFTQEFQRIKGQLREQIKTGELLVFSVPEQVEIGKPGAMVIGVRNTAQNVDTGKVCFRVEVKCVRPFTPGSFCDQRSSQNDVAVGGFDAESGLPVASDRNWYRSILGMFDLRNFEGEVYDAEMLVRGVRPDTYSMEVNVYKEPEDRDCGNEQFGTNYQQSALYSTKSFTLKVV